MEVREQTPWIEPPREPGRGHCTVEGSGRPPQTLSGHCAPLVGEDNAQSLEFLGQTSPSGDLGSTPLFHQVQKDSQTGTLSTPYWPLGQKLVSVECLELLDRGHGTRTAARPPPCPLRGVQGWAQFRARGPSLLPANGAPTPLSTPPDAVQCCQMLCPAVPCQMPVLQNPLENTHLLDQILDQPVCSLKILRVVAFQKPCQKLKREQDLVKPPPSGSNGPR